MPHIKKGFPPISNEDAKVLILGSMPGQRSLDKHEYYAHPSNAFWRIMNELVSKGSSPIPDYKGRLKDLMAVGIALWDVLDSCERKGSLDSDIRKETANDFVSFFAQHPHITHVLFNGAKAEQSFGKLGLPEQKLSQLKCERLPSTSPAHARMSYEKKLNIWREKLLKAGVKINP